jgi:hypothetical protein
MCMVDYLRDMLRDTGRSSPRRASGRLVRGRGGRNGRGKGRFLSLRKRFEVR